MRVRLKYRVILVYLGVVGFASLFFALYFLLSPSSKSRNGIERAAVDRWLDVDKGQSYADPHKKIDLNLQHFPKGQQQGPPDTIPSDDDERIIQLPNSKTQVLLPPKKRLLELSHDELSFLYHKYTTQVQTSCRAVVRLGHVTDGGWEVCDDPPYKLESPCLVYSFGVGDDFSFDDAVARKYGCEVHSFDPSMKAGDHKRESSVQFHALGLSVKVELRPDGWNMSTLPEIRKSLGHQSKPLSILKLDIEEWEWKVLPELLKGSHLSDTRHLLMELHQCDGCSRYDAEQTDKEATKDRYIMALGILKDLYNLGFRIFWQHQNSACRYISKFTLSERFGCCELHMVQTDPKAYGM